MDNVMDTFRNLANDMVIKLLASSIIVALFYHAVLFGLFGCVVFLDLFYKMACLEPSESGNANAGGYTFGLPVWHTTGA